MDDVARVGGAALLGVLAALRPLERPPTNASAPSCGDDIKASLRSPPIPESNVTGNPARTIKACDKVKAWKPPCEGVLAMTALPASN